MKHYFILGLFLATCSASAADDTLSCGFAMYQFKADQKMFPLIGDSNQRVTIQLKETESGALRGEGEVRFQNDQSADLSNSLHGAKVIATYLDGTLAVSMTLLQYETKSGDSPFSAIATVAGANSDGPGLKDAAKKLSFAYLSPKAPDPLMDLWPLVKSSAVKDYELRSVELRNCW